MIVVIRSLGALALALTVMTHAASAARADDIAVEDAALAGSVGIADASR